MVMEGTRQTSVRMIIGYRATMTLPQGEKNVWEGTTYAPSAFRDKLKFSLPTSRHRLDLVFVLCSSDWTLHPHHRESMHLSPFVIGLFASPPLINGESPTGKSSELSPKSLNFKRTKRLGYLFYLSLPFLNFEYVYITIKSVICQVLFQNFLSSTLPLPRLQYHGTTLRWCQYRNHIVHYRAR